MPTFSRIFYREDKKRRSLGKAPWRVHIPAEYSDNGKRRSLFFTSKEAAASKVRELKLAVEKKKVGIEDISPSEISSFFYARDALLKYDIEFRRGIDLLLDVLGSGISFNELRKATEIGKRILDQKKHSLSFEKAAREMIDLKESVLKRRPATIMQIKTTVNRVGRFAPFFRGMALSEISVDDCRKALDQSFTTIKQRDDARRVLSGVFTLGIKRGWCDTNPMSKIEAAHHEEREILALSVDEVRALFDVCRGYHSEVAKQRDLSPCIAPLALLVFGGVRPEEVRRLNWDDIDFEEGLISIRSSSSKTGGTRHVTMGKAMRAWLEYVKRDDTSGPICSRDWRYRWQEIRERAGWGGKNGRVWQTDALRHTFASYHAKRYKNFPLLQMEMGHGSALLLRQRYTNLKGITEKTAKEFWNIFP